MTVDSTVATTVITSDKANRIGSIVAMRTAATAKVTTAARSLNTPVVRTDDDAAVSEIIRERNSPCGTRCK
ncbi:hypothetical protein CQ031_07675 [Microbacterium sp. MYb40]|nr:hypothetical protein CQ031_07675 [Microbacterium sp. MYb40]PRB66449.1 hypothetical protein CQ021_11475 [Microbacterium sp. MYb24]